MAASWRWLLGLVGVPCAAREVIVMMENGGTVALSTRGGSAFRARFLPKGHEADPPIDTVMVRPENNDADYKYEDGAVVTSFGVISVSTRGVLKLQKEVGGATLFESDPVDFTAASIAFSTNGQLYGHGASPLDAGSLTHDACEPLVCNRATFVPYYYSTDGYGALGVVSQSEKHRYPADYKRDNGKIVWSYRGAFELYLIPANTLTLGTLKYYELIGAPVVPPRYAFGFIASRWGWKDVGYINWILQKFRDDKYPIDAIIVDFEWFVNETDYGYDRNGKSWYDDFGYNSITFPQPNEQFKKFRDVFHVHFGGIRKPRLGNSFLLEEVRSKGYMLPGGEPGGKYPPVLDQSYAFDRNLDFSIAEVRKWYGEKLVHYYDDGVSFWWNDEGETDYFTNYWWNVAERDTLHWRTNKRFFSLNRAWSPGMARIGASVWTGDIDATWEDLQGTPGMMLNWIMSGAPYVACDIGGFDFDNGGHTTSFMLTRWMQLGVFMPLMRVHSTISIAPHWPWRLGDSAATAIRSALELRYRLVPYHYSCAHMMYRQVRMWIRPLVMDFPKDEESWTITTEWMDGDILAAPIVNPEGERRTYLPPGTWYRFQSTDTLTGPKRLSGLASLDEMPMFVKPGTILTLAPVIQHTGELPGGPLEVQVYGGADGNFTLVEDDGETILYFDQPIKTTHFQWNDESKMLSWTVEGDADAAGAHAFREIAVIFYDGLGESPGKHELPKRPLERSGSVHAGAGASKFI